MKRLTYAVLLNVNLLDRTDAEKIQNQEFNIFFASGCQFGAREPLTLAIAERLEESTDGITVMSLCDFMDAYNNEEISEFESESWMTYVQVVLETQADRDAQDQEFNDFVVELNALCDEWGYPHMNAEQQREAFEVYESVQESDPNGSHVWVEDALYAIYEGKGKMNTIEYKDEEYPTRTFLVQIPDEGEPREITISTQSLDGCLSAEREYNEEMKLGRSIAEEEVDDQIYFFVDDKEIGLRPEVICENHLDCPIKFIEEIV